MLHRCYNEKLDRYPNYGGRGITVCDRWRYSFSDFCADMGPCPEGLSIEREDVDGDYEPGNCVWANEKTQMRNRTDTRRITYNGETKSAAEWSEVTGIKSHTLLKRLDNSAHDWTVGQALGYEPPPEIIRGMSVVALRKAGDPELAERLYEKRKNEMRNTGRNRLLTYNGATHCAEEWREITGIRAHTILKRLDRAATEWTVGQALGFEPAPVKRTRWSS